MADYRDLLDGDGAPGVASFRGEPFEVEGDSSRYGRRGPVHEYVNREVATPEDTGDLNPTFTVTGWVVGDDYRRKRDALIKAARTPGPGILIHPQYGRIKVKCHDLTVTHTAEEGRVSSLAWTFSLWGELAFPTAAVQPAVRVDAKRVTLLEKVAAALGELFDPFTQAGHVLAEAIDTAEEAVGQLESDLAPYREALEDAEEVFTALGKLRTDTAALVTAGVTGWIQRVQDVMAAVGDLAALLDMGSTGEDGGGDGGGGGSDPTTPSEVAIEDNRRALDLAVRVSVLAEAAAAAADTDFQVVEDAARAGGRLADQLGQLLEEADDRELYEAIHALRTAVVEDITTRSLDLAHLVLLELKTTRSVWDLAQELYGDGSRGQEILDRNDIPNPLFVRQPLWVASE